MKQKIEYKSPALEIIQLSCADIMVGSPDEPTVNEETIQDAGANRAPERGLWRK